MVHTHKHIITNHLLMWMIVALVFVQEYMPRCNTQRERRFSTNNGFCRQTHREAAATRDTERKEMMKEVLQ